MYNIIFTNSSRIELGQWTFASGSTQADQLWSTSDVEKSSKLTKLSVDGPPVEAANVDRIDRYINIAAPKDKFGVSRKLVPGQPIYYVSNITGAEQSFTFDTIISGVRLTLSANPTDDMLESMESTYQKKGGLNGFLQIYAYLNVLENSSRLYSYPISSYRGAHTNDKNTVCLFFEKSRKCLDEVKVKIGSANTHMEFIKSFHKKIRRAKEDLVFSHKYWGLGVDATTVSVFSPVISEDLQLFKDIE